MSPIRIGEAPPLPCMHPSHFPPGMMVLTPGVYQHTCPGCGHVTTYTVYPGPMCDTSSVTNTSL